MSWFDEYVRDSISMYPPKDGRGIRVIRRKIDGGYWAHTFRAAKWYTIVIDERLGQVAAWLLFLHELSHIHSWDEREPVDHNDCGEIGCPHFGCYYARFWRDIHHDADHWL